MTETFSFFGRKMTIVASFLAVAVEATKKNSWLPKNSTSFEFGSGHVCSSVFPEKIFLFCFFFIILFWNFFKEKFKKCQNYRFFFKFVKKNIFFFLKILFLVELPLNELFFVESCQFYLSKKVELNSFRCN